MAELDWDDAERAEAARRPVDDDVFAVLRELRHRSDGDLHGDFLLDAADMLERHYHQLAIAKETIARLSSRVAVDVPEGLLRETIVRVHREAKQTSSWSVGSAEYFDAMTKAIADALSAEEVVRR